MSTDIFINPSFKALIPPLSNEEFTQLEANIVTDGCRDPLVLWNRTIIDGHNRFDICQRHGIQFKSTNLTFTSDDEASIWIIQNQFGRRNLAPYSKVELALKLEPLLKAKAKDNQKAGGNKRGKGRSKVGSQNSVKALDRQKELAKIAGVSHDTIAKGKFVAEHADEATKKRLRDNQISVHRVAKELKDKIQRETRKTKRLKAASGTKPDKRIMVGDFRHHSDRIANGSISLIFTDPPYDKDATNLFPSLAQFSADKLADGGSILMYLGHLQLPAVFEAFKDKLRHWWTCACFHSGPTVLMREYGIRVGWKPMVWFVKGTRDDISNIVIDTVTGQSEKESHDWQQAESEALYWIEQLCPKDGIVYDPFFGGGTTGVAANKLGRKWFASEIDPEQAGIAAKRLQS